MHADKPFRRAEIAQRAARCRAHYSADHFELESEPVEEERGFRFKLVERDPCEDPQPGDVLAVGTDVREVWDRTGDQIEYMFPRRAASRWLALPQWQRWARNAEVRKVGP